MNLEVNEAVDRAWLPDAEGQIAPELVGEFRLALDAAYAAIQQTPTIGDPIGFQSGTVCRRHAVGVGQMEVAYRVDPELLEVRVLGVGRPDKLEGAFPGRVIELAGTGEDARRLADRLTNANVADLATGRSQVARRLQAILAAAEHARTNADREALEREAAPVVRRLEVYAIAQGRQLELALERGGSPATLQARDAYTGIVKNKDVDRTSERARIRAGRTCQEWGRADAIAAVRAEHTLAPRIVPERAVDRGMGGHSL